MSRKDAFQGLSTHPWLGRIYSRLSAKERALAEAFIDENEHLDRDKFEYALNRLFLDKPSKPKNHTAILELLSSANSTSHIPE